MNFGCFFEKNQPVLNLEEPLMMKRLSLFVSLLVLAAMLFSTACAESGLPEFPQLIKVDFEEGKYEPLPMEGRAPYAVNEANFSADGLRYSDPTLDIQVHKLRAFDTPIFMAYVQIASPTQLRTEQARPYPSEATARTNVMGKRANAVLAVNGDWFVFHNAGIIYRQGELLRNRAHIKYDGLFIDMDGNFHIVNPLTEEGFAEIGQPIYNSFCFGPGLVKDGEIVDNSDRVITYKQRMAIGQLDELTYVIVCSDGPEERDSVGLTIPQISEIMQALGCSQAYNLDGGASTYMYFNFAKVNGQKAAKARSIGDILYFASAVPME